MTESSPDRTRSEAARHRRHRLGAGSGSPIWMTLTKNGGGTRRRDHHRSLGRIESTGLNFRRFIDSAALTLKPVRTVGTVHGTGQCESENHGTSNKADRVFRNCTRAPLMRAPMVVRHGLPIRI